MQLVNIGSGVSILKVNSADSYQRISGLSTSRDLFLRNSQLNIKIKNLGTSIGGGTVWGLLSLLTNVMDYDGILGKGSFTLGCWI